MNRRILHLQLLVVAVAITAVVAAACAGGRSGAAPCCAAQGSVQNPGGAPSFAPTSTPALFAQPFVVDSSACLKFSALGQPDQVLASQPAGDAVSIDATLHYTVHIATSAEGKLVQIVVFQRTGTPKVRGIGLIGAPIQPQQGGAAIQVAPIRLSDSADPARVGESALEAAALCELKTSGQMRRLLPADVRAVVTSEITATFTAAEGPAVIERLFEYDSALEGVESVSGATQVVAFRQMRADADAAVDASGLSGRPADMGRAQFYADNGATYGLDPLTQTTFPPPWTIALTTMAQFIDQKVGKPPAPETALPTHLSMRRLSFMLRYQAARKNLDTTIAAPLERPTPAAPVPINPDATPAAGGMSINQAKAAAVAAILNTNSLPAIATDWFRFGDAVSRSMDTQLWPGSNDLNNIYTSAYDKNFTNQGGFGGKTSFQGTLNLYYRMTGATAGYFDDIHGFVAQQVNTGAISTNGKLVVNSLEFHLAASSSVPAFNQAPTSP